MNYVLRSFKILNNCIMNFKMIIQNNKKIQKYWNQNMRNFKNNKKMKNQ